MDYGNQLDDGEPAVTDDEVVKEAVDRWKAIKDWQGVEDQRLVEDIKFANGDARNSHQWPTKIYQERTAGSSSELPCLTINATRTHNDFIINQMAQNDFGPRIRPTGGKASYKSAQVMQSIIRHIQEISKFNQVRRKVSEHQVDGGIGYVLVETGYKSYRSFEQEIYLRAARDPTGIYLDPWIREADGSDAKFGFVFERMPRHEFARKYPKWKNKVGTQPIGSAFADWISDKEIMLAKYYRKREVDDTLVTYKEADGTVVEKLASEIRKESGEIIYKDLMQRIENGDIDGRKRKTANDEVEWFLIAGDTVIDSGDWAGKFIPICRCVGREIIIDGTLDRKGHTRPLVDPQRMLNYNASMSVQMVAWQPLSPWVAAARAIEGQEQWKTQNINAFPVLTYNDVDDEAPVQLQKVDPPMRQPMPQPSQAHEAGQQTAERQMMLISGQWQQTLGKQDNRLPESGLAINAKQQQGDIATAHFPEHQVDMLRFIGVQLLDLIPKIYDTERALHIFDDDLGERIWIRLDPNQQEVLKELQVQETDKEAIKLAFNPTIGEYECISEPGPDIATKRQEAYAEIEVAMKGNAALMGVIGDLLWRNSDADGAMEIADRLKREIQASKPYLFDEKVNPALMAAQQQNQKLVSLNSELMQKLATIELKLRGKEELRDVEAFRADTDRMGIIVKAIKELMPTPAMRAQFEHEIGQDARQHIYSMIQQANQPEVSEDEAA